MTIGHPDIARPRRAGSRWLARALRAMGVLAIVAGALWTPVAAAVCQAHAVDRMVFTGYSPVGAGTWARAVINYACTGLTASATLSLSTPRTIASPTHTLAFEVYQDPGRDAVMPGAPPLPLDVNGTSVVVWGFLGPQNAAPGTYSGDVTIRIDSDGGQSLSRNMQVSMTLAGSCVIDPGALAFGDYDPAADRPGLGNINVRCSAGTPFSVGLGTGNNPGPGGFRQMASTVAPDLLRYQLYLDSGRSIVWDGVALVTGTASTTAAIGLPVYGLIPAGQTVAAGPYSDTVQATINF